MSKNIIHTVQSHIVESEDGRSTAGPRAMQGHVQNTMWSLHTVLLQDMEYINSTLAL